MYTSIIIFLIFLVNLQCKNWNSCWIRYPWQLWICRPEPFCTRREFKVNSIRKVSYSCTFLSDFFNLLRSTTKRSGTRVSNKPTVFQKRPANKICYFRSTWYSRSWQVFNLYSTWAGLRYVSWAPIRRRVMIANRRARTRPLPWVALLCPT